MSSSLALLLSGMAGAALGVVFFGGLWWTVRKAVTSGQPALWFFGSVLLRMAIALAGFYFVSDGHWQRLAGVPARLRHGALHPDAAAGPPLGQANSRDEGAVDAP